MIYRIFKRIDRKHRLNQETKLYELIEKPRFYIKRKGKIFGFWHQVGDWLCTTMGDRFCVTDEFDSIEQTNSYLNCWHVEEYGKDEPLEVQLDFSVYEEGMLYG